MINSYKPYIIAELSGNHNGDINRALLLIEKAKEAGANAVKLQTYTADTMTIDHSGPDFMINKGLWSGYNLYELYKVAHTPWEWHPILFEKGKSLGITIFSTPFDHSSVDFLESLNAPIYKIASFELIDLDLIEKVARTGKPIIMSTGMASLVEIEEAVDICHQFKCPDLTLLHCVSAYPAPISACNLATMLDLKKQFPQVRIGLSDHTMGITVAIAAVALGAEVIEKHVTLSRAEGGVDFAFSLEPEELKTLCMEAHNVYESIGSVNYERSSIEKENAIFRRSIYAIEDIKPGDILSRENIKVIRPGYGLPPKYYKEILGKKSKSFIGRGARIQLDIIIE